MSKDGQRRRDKKGWTEECTCSRGCLFYIESFVKLAASAKLLLLLFIMPVQRVKKRGKEISFFFLKNEWILTGEPEVPSGSMLLAAHSFTCSDSNSTYVHQK